MHLPLLLTLALTALTTAIPSETVNALAKCSDNRHPWQGGGCEKNWGGGCAQRCKNQAGKENCCAGTTGSFVDGSGCIWGWETCECYCYTKK
ncbi:hypothetical protein QBC34DRAFT_387081 [Podospora aff. communis PSN243]|uniref:Uncharacterized protein n=1 Tax=Podospora aff. communis PSN243 TaxID=3040156 RepID=A0AAV9G5D0_9PEZI|nr:hypothetical protein QBC34DRAFT_387081 [Podospora aff. communis PSN243]